VASTHAAPGRVAGLSGQFSELHRVTVNSVTAMGKQHRTSQLFATWQTQMRCGLLPQVLPRAMFSFHAVQ